MLLSDTILALSSPPNSGGGDNGTRAILRIAGPAALKVARSAIPDLPHHPGYHGNLTLPLLHPTLKIAAALIFLAPRSFTGDCLVELHLPNSPALLRAVTDKILQTNSQTTRLANPGEFSARAFFNQKIDLTQAEGIAATISATSALELRAAASLREGFLYRETKSFTEELARLLSLVEAGIDFTDEEDVSFIDLDTLLLDLSQLEAGLQYLINSAVRIDRITTLPTIVFIGDPNVGKSSLINALAGTERSIVSHIAGTTRDMLSVVLHTPRGDIRLIDVPGEESPTDDLRQKMMAARHAALLEADLIIEVLADDKTAICGLALDSRHGADAYTVQNKMDLLPPEELKTEFFDNGSRIPLRGQWQLVSTKTGRNIDLLRDELARMIFRKHQVAPHIPALNQRHRILLHECKLAIEAAQSAIINETAKSHPELLAADLRRALDLLGQITGTISPDEILGRIFSQFCIGK